MSKGAIPAETWTTTKLGSAFDIELGKMLSPEASIGRDLKPYLANRNVQWNRVDVDDVGYMAFARSERERFLLKKGDLLICEGGEIGRAAIWNGELSECYYQKAIHRLRPKNPIKIDPRYSLHYMKYAAENNFFVKFSAQTSISHLTGEKLVEFELSHPAPLAEQRRIAEILDGLDESIRAAQWVSTKSEELRAGLIREAMREGLELVGSVEASKLGSVQGIERGEWTAVVLGRLLQRIDAGHSPDLEDTPAGLGQWGVLKVSAVGRDGFRPSENKVVRSRALYNESLCVQIGDLIMTRANTPELVGMSCVVEETLPGLMLCDKTLRLKVIERAAPAEYVDLVLGMPEVRRQIEIAATGTSGSMKNISQWSIRRLTVPLAAPDNLARIVRADALCREQISAHRAEVKRLRLLKKGLMEDLLAGQVRVRRSDMGALASRGTG